MLSSARVVVAGPVQTEEASWPSAVLRRISSHADQPTVSGAASATQAQA